MPRSVNHAASRRRRKKILKLAKGYFGRKKNVWTVAKNQVERSWQYAYRDRKVKKREFRKLWIQRINAGARQHGMSYSKLMGAIHKSNITLNRKVLADLAMNHPEAFEAVVKVAQDPGSMSSFASDEPTQVAVPLEVAPEGVSLVETEAELNAEPEVESHDSEAEDTEVNTQITDAVAVAEEDEAEVSAEEVEPEVESDTQEEEETPAAEVNEEAPVDGSVEEVQASADTEASEEGQDANDEAPASEDEAPAGDDEAPKNE